MAAAAYRASTGPRLQDIGAGVLRYGLVIILVSVGALKFTAYGFAHPSEDPGQFLLKDLLLLGAAVWTAGEALAAGRRKRQTAAAPS